MQSTISTAQNVNEPELKAIIHKLIKIKAKGIYGGQEIIREMLAVYVKEDFASLLIHTSQQSSDQGFHCSSATQEELSKAHAFLQNLDQEKIVSWRKSQRPFAVAIALGFAQTIKEHKELLGVKSNTNKKKKKKRTHCSAASQSKDITPEEITAIRNIMATQLRKLNNGNDEKECSTTCEASAATANSNKKHEQPTTVQTNPKQLIKEHNIISGIDGKKVIDEERLLALIKAHETNPILVQEILDQIQLVRRENTERELKEKQAQEAQKQGQEQEKEKIKEEELRKEQHESKQAQEEEKTKKEEKLTIEQKHHNHHRQNRQKKKKQKHQNYQLIVVQFLTQTKKQQQLLQHRSSLPPSSLSYLAHQHPPQI